MTYLLPRTLAVLIAWAISCVAIKKLFPDVDSSMFGIAGACWVTGGVAYFGYLGKLRRDIEQLERNRRYGVAGAQAPLSPAE
jgi:uncharacterized membrane protein YccC